MTADKPRIPRIGKWLSALVATAVLAVALAWMAGVFHSKIAPGERADGRPVTANRPTVPATFQNVDETVTVVASVQPRRKTDVASQLLADVLEVKVQAGQRVSAGETLIVLDDRELLAQQREALAAVNAAEADLLVRTREYDRAKEMSARRAGTQEDLDRAEAAFKVAQAQLRRAKELVARIEVQLSHTQIKATSPGIVAERYVDPGDQAAPGKPLLLVQDSSEWELHASVPESQALRVAVGQPLAFRIESAGVSAVGPVREIVPLAQQGSRSVVIKLTIPKDQSLPFFAGMFGRVTIPIGRSSWLTVPAIAVKTEGQLDLVEVADANDKLSRRFVRVGRSTDGNVEILSGLAEGEKVALPAK